MLRAEKKIYQAKVSERRAINNSEGEFDFAKQLDYDPNVLMFTQIKKANS